MGTAGEGPALPGSLPAPFHSSFSSKTDTLGSHVATLCCPNGSYFFLILKEIEMFGTTPKSIMGPSPVSTMSNG